MLETMNPLQATHLPASRESAWWRAVKHGTQLAMAGAAVLLVVEGGSRPLMAFSWAGAAFIAMCAMVLVDRQRFVEDGLADVEMELVEVIGPMHAPLTLAEPRPAYVHQAEVPFLASVT
jgi:hypothetical protein